MAKEVDARAYTKHYHIAPATFEMAESLPGWMKIRTDVESNGFQFLNAVAGMELQRVDELLAASLANQFPGTAYLNEANNVYITAHDQNQGVMPIPDNISALALTHSGGYSMMDLTQVDDVIDLFSLPPTRIVPSEYKSDLIVTHVNNFEITTGLSTILGGANYSDWRLTEGTWAVSPTDELWRADINISSAVFDKTINVYQAAQCDCSVDRANSNLGPIVHASEDAQNCYFLLMGSGTGWPNATRFSIAKLYRRNAGTFTLLWEGVFDYVTTGTYKTCRLTAKPLTTNDVQLTVEIGPNEDNLSIAKQYVDSSSDKLVSGKVGVMSTSAWMIGFRFKIDNFKIYEPERKGTRYLSNDFLDGQTIQALSYFTDYSPSGSIIANEGLVIGIEKDAIIASGSAGAIVLSSGLSSFEDGLYLHDEPTWGKLTQKYETTGIDELLEFNGSGHAVLSQIPIEGTLKVYDIMILDTAGNASLIDSNRYSATYSASGTIQWDVPASGRSRYIAEYDYGLYTRGRFVTTTQGKWNNQLWVNTGPLFSTTPLPEYEGTIFKPEESYSTTETSGRLLTIDPLEIRPGVTARVDFKYTTSVVGTWNAPTTTDLLLTIDDPWFKDTHALGISLFSTNTVAASGINITRDMYNPLISGSLIRIPSIPLATSGYYWDALAYKIYYNGEINYNDLLTPLQFTTVQSLSTTTAGSHPYPDDYILVNQVDPENHKRAQFIYPMTVIPITHPSGRILELMKIADTSDFEIKIPLDFRGIAYDRHQNTIWALEQTNTQLYKYTSDRGKLLGKYNILKPNKNMTSNRKSIEVSGSLFPFIPQQPSSVDLRGLVYFNEFLYIIDTTSNVIRRINTFDSFTMDEEYSSNGSGVYKPFPLPTGAIPSEIWDISLNRDDNLLVTIPSGYVTFEFKYDYWIPDTNESRIIYREQYQSVDVDLNIEQQSDNRGEI